MTQTKQAVCAKKKKKLRLTEMEYHTCSKVKGGGSCPRGEEERTIEGGELFKTFRQGVKGESRGMLQGRLCLQGAFHSHVIPFAPYRFCCRLLQTIFGLLLILYFCYSPLCDFYFGIFVSFRCFFQWTGRVPARMADASRSGGFEKGVGFRFVECSDWNSFIRKVNEW